MRQPFWLSGLCLLLFFLYFGPSQAAEPETTDIRILVDISGSMKQTDPNNLRIPAVNLLTELIPEGAQAGIWTFGQYVNRLLPPTRVDSQWRGLAQARAQQINSAGLFTNLTEVLDNAANDLNNSFNEKNIIVLTDGYIDMPDGRNDMHKQRLLNEVLPKYIAAGAKIHTLALSDDVDKELLRKISTQTHGLYLEAHSSDDLMRVFLKAFDRAVPSEQVPLNDNRFSIDGSVTEFTALIFRSSAGNTKLISPSGQVYDSARSKQDKQLRWHHDMGFELITIAGPEPGQWQVDAQQDPDNRIQVLSDLKLKVEGIPTTIYAGDPIEMRAMLTDHGQTVKAAEILRTSELTLSVTAPDGRTGSKRLSDAEKIPETGIYVESFNRLEAEGEYQFQLVLRGKTFERRQALVANLVAPLKMRTQEVVEQEKFILMVTPEDSVDSALTRLHLSVTAPDGQSAVHEVQFDRAARNWSFELLAQAGPGRYVLEISGRVVLENKRTMNYRPASVAVSFPLGLSADRQEKGLASIHKDEATINKNTIQLPDLARAYEQQQQALMPVEESPKEPELLLTGNEEKLNIWLYVGIAASVLGIIAVISFVVLRQKKEKTPPSEKERNDALDKEKQDESAVIPEDLIQEDIPVVDEQAADEEFVDGDFDDFEGEEEVEIPVPEEQDVDDAFFDLDELNEDFAIDPDADSEAENDAEKD